MKDANSSDWKRCDKCLYWQRSFAGSDMGMCRRRAPMIGHWPKTLESDWCGELDMDPTKRLSSGDR